MKILAAGVSALLLIASFHCNADYSSAHKFLADEEHEKAFAEFKRLAEFGHGDAMFQLANMYEQGTGTEQNLMYAYAWYMLAIDFGNEEAKDNYRKIRSKVPSRKEGKLHYKALDKQYGKEAHIASYQPIKDKSGHTAQYIRARKAPSPHYGNHSSEQGAWVTIGYDINAQGQVVNAKVLGDFPKDAISEVVLETMGEWSFQVPNNYLGRPQPVYNLTKTFERTLTDNFSQRDYEAQKDEYHYKLKALAVDGNSYAQARYAMMLEGDIVQSTTDTALDWYYRAAVNGNVDAQLWLVHCFEYGTACKADQKKAYAWLERASQSEDPRALYQFALVKGDYDKVHYDIAHSAELLAKAAHQQYMPAMVAYAKLLAFTSEQSLRDYDQALKYAELARANDENNPTLLSVLGVVHSNLGNVQKAEAFLQQALAQAKERNWYSEPFAELLENQTEMMAADGGNTVY